MLVLQQIKVLPAGAKFKIIDEHRTEVMGKVAEDYSLIFDNADIANRYYKIYSNFRVVNLDIENGRGEWDDDYYFVLTVR